MCRLPYTVGCHGMEPSHKARADFLSDKGDVNAMEARGVSGEVRVREKSSKRKTGARAASAYLLSSKIWCCALSM